MDRDWSEVEVTETGIVFIRRRWMRSYWVHVWHNHVAGCERLGLMMWRPDLLWYMIAHELRRYGLKREVRVVHRFGDDIGATIGQL